jgi:hypothetical protein
MKRIIGSWFQLIATGTEGLAPSCVKAKLIARVNRLALYVALINLFIGVPVYVYLVPSGALLSGVLLEIGLCALPLFLNHTRQYSQARMAMYLILCAASVYFCCLLGPLTRVVGMVAFLVIVSTLIYTKWTARILCYVLAALVYVGVQLNVTHGFIQALTMDKTVADQVHGISYGVTIFLLATAACWYGELRPLMARRPKAQPMQGQ